MAIINHGYKMEGGFQTQTVNILVFIMPICLAKAVNTSLQMEKKKNQRQATLADKLTSVKCNFQ